MHRDSWKLWAAAVLSAGLLELPFPLAGPMPPWRSIFAWFALAPLLVAILSPANLRGRHPLGRGFLLGYVCGVLWYAGNCYWIYATMRIYGGLPAWVSALMLAGFSLVLGLYFGIFAWGVVLLRRATGSLRLALAAAPVLWVALELAGARITSVPWDQLGYSQVDNAVLTLLAPWTGVYGISFVLVVAECPDRRRTAARPMPGKAHLGHLRRDPRLRRCRGYLCAAAQAGSYGDRGAHPAESQCGRIQQLGRKSLGQRTWRNSPGRQPRRARATSPEFRKPERRWSTPVMPVALHASRSGGMAGVACAVFRGRSAL